MDIQKKLFIHSVDLLARRPYHSAELRKKLEKKGKDLLKKQQTEDENSYRDRENPDSTPGIEDLSTHIDAVISKLLEYRYIDDNEYLKTYIRSQLNKKPQGTLLIKQKLRQKGIPADQFEHLLQQDQSDQLKLAISALDKKIRTLKTSTPRQKKEKAYRFLCSRGFAQNTIMQALNEVEDDIRNGRYHAGSIEEHIRRVKAK